MQALAQETNFSETVFVLPATTDDADVRIRIFTPAVELPFAGHPTLGSAFVLGGPLQKIVIRLETGAGVVPVELEREGPKIVFGRMEQPIPTWEPVADPAAILAALGVERSGLPVERYDLGPGHVYVELELAEAVAGDCRPDIGALAAATPDGANCFAHVDGDRWKTRMFAPNHGVAEDPATGSAAGPLAIHLARHGRIAFGEEIEISQGAEIGRPSTLYATRRGRRRPRSSASRSAARPSLVARGEFGFLSATRRDLGQLARERRPEDAAVAREVEPVPRRVDDRVRVVVGDRDGASRRQPASRLPPGRAGVVRDEQRRLRVDDRDDRRARARPRRRRRGRFSTGSGAGSNASAESDRAVLEIDREARRRPSRRARSRPQQRRDDRRRAPRRADRREAGVRVRRCTRSRTRRPRRSGRASSGCAVTCSATPPQYTVDAARAVRDEDLADAERQRRRRAPPPPRRASFSTQTWRSSSGSKSASSSSGPVVPARTSPCPSNETR